MRPLPATVSQKKSHVPTEVQNGTWPLLYILVEQGQRSCESRSSCGRRGDRRPPGVQRPAPLFPLGLEYNTRPVFISEILFAKVSEPHYNDSLPHCTFSQENQAETNAWFTSRFLYHIGGFLLPMLVMAWCYVGVVHRLCQAQRRPQRQKAVRVAILVTFGLGRAQPQRRGTSP